jgi:hypothetical protein
MNKDTKRTFYLITRLFRTRRYYQPKKCIGNFLSRKERQRGMITREVLVSELGIKGHSVDLRRLLSVGYVHDANERKTLLAVSSS